LALSSWRFAANFRFLFACDRGENRGIYEERKIDDKVLVICHLCVFLGGVKLCQEGRKGQKSRQVIDFRGNIFVGNLAGNATKCAMGSEMSKAEMKGRAGGKNRDRCCRRTPHFGGQKANRQSRPRGIRADSQALEEGVAVVTPDEKFGLYRGPKVVW
jgi:hypothetical protein